MGNTFGPKGLFKGSKTLVSKTDQPDIIVNFFDADGLSGKNLAEIDFLVRGLVPEDRYVP